MVAYCKQLPPGRVILDCGCGEAVLAQRVAHRHTVRSFDLKEMDILTDEGKTHKIERADMMKLPVAGNSADVVIMCLSLMSVDYLDAVREAHRVLKKGGELVIAEVSSRFLPPGHDGPAPVGPDSDGDDVDDRRIPVHTEGWGHIDGPQGERGQENYSKEGRGKKKHKKKSEGDQALASMEGRARGVAALARHVNMSVDERKQERQDAVQKGVTLFVQDICDVGFRRIPARVTERGATQQEHHRHHEQRSRRGRKKGHGKPVSKGHTDKVDEHGDGNQARDANKDGDEDEEDEEKTLYARDALLGRSHDYFVTVAFAKGSARRRRSKAQRTHDAHVEQEAQDAQDAGAGTDGRAMARRVGRSGFYLATMYIQEAIMSPIPHGTCPMR